MSNVPIGANEDSNAPWNEKEDIFEEFEVNIVLIRKEKMKLKVDEQGFLLDSEEDEIKDWAKMIAKNLNCEYIDYEIL
jgi:hypothetical protein